MEPRQSTLAYCWYTISTAVETPDLPAQQQRDSSAFSTDSIFLLQLLDFQVHFLFNVFPCDWWATAGKQRQFPICHHGCRKAIPQGPCGGGTPSALFVYHNAAHPRCLHACIRLELYVPIKLRVPTLWTHLTLRLWPGCRYHSAPLLYLLIPQPCRHYT